MPSFVDNIFNQKINVKLQIRSVERGICPTAMSTMNELLL